MLSMTEHPAAYVIAFVLLFAGLYGLYHLIQPHLLPYYAALAGSVCWLLGPLDPAVSCSENYLLYNGVRALVVVEGCDGVTFILLFLAAVLPFPMSWKSRLLGLAWLIPTIIVVNWLRLVVLSVIRFYLPSSFDFVHVYLFQPFMIALTLMLFFLWLGARNDTVRPA